MYTHSIGGLNSTPSGALIPLYGALIPLHLINLSITPVKGTTGSMYQFCMACLVLASCMNL